MTWKTPYRPEELTECVRFLRETSTPDGSGGFQLSFAEVANVAAMVRPMSGRERENANMIQSSANYLVVIRYRDDIRENDILEWRGRKMNIRFVKDRGPRAIFLEIEAEAGVAL